MVSGRTAADLTDAQSALLEKVRMDPVSLYSKLAGLSNRISGMKRVEKVNQRAYKIHQELYAGGTMQMVNRNGGTMGTGSGPKTANLSGGIHYMNFVIELTDKLISQTESAGGGSANGGSVINAFQLSVANAMLTISRHLDRYLWNDGKGYLTEGASAAATAGSTTTYTFAGSTDMRGVSHLLEGMAVDVYNSSDVKLTNTTTSGYPFIIDSIDWGSRIVVLLGVPSAVATGAKLAVVALGASNVPTTSTPATGSSSWPFGADTFLHGVPYANSTTTTDYYLGTLRSTRPNLNCANYNASGNAWTTFMTHAVRDRLLDARGKEALSGLEGICHFAQRVQVQATGTSITNFPRTGKSGIVDPTPSSGADAMTSFEWGDVNHQVITHQYRNRIDYVNWSLWERPEDFPGPRPVKTDGAFDIRIVDTQTGGRMSTRQWIWECSMDFCCVDPGKQGVITNLAVPSGY